jgi:hypothetical protein
MRFLLRRYLLGIAIRRHYLWLALLPAVFYIPVSAIKPEVFVVTQQLAVAGEAPVVVSADPVGFRRFDEIAAEGRFFDDSAALRDLRNRLRLEDPFVRDSVEDLTRSLSLRLLPGDRAEVAYEGADSRLGRRLVEFYSGRLVAISEEGNLRVTSQPLRKAVEAGVRSDSSPARILGSENVEGRRSLWRRERAAPLVWIVLISLTATLAILCLAEWRDPSFKSERQVARYLGTPILGSVPDLGPLSERLGRTDRSG